MYKWNDNKGIEKSISVARKNMQVIEELKKEYELYKDYEFNSKLQIESTISFRGRVDGRPKLGISITLQDGRHYYGLHFVASLAKKKWKYDDGRLAWNDNEANIIMKIHGLYNDFKKQFTGNRLKDVYEFVGKIVEGMDKIDLGLLYKKLNSELKNCKMSKDFS